MDKILDLKLSIKQAEMDKDWGKRQTLLDELTDFKKTIEESENE